MTLAINSFLKLLCCILSSLSNEHSAYSLGVPFPSFTFFVVFWVPSLSYLPSLCTSLGRLTFRWIFQLSLHSSLRDPLLYPFNLEEVSTSFSPPVSGWPPRTGSPSFLHFAHPSVQDTACLLCHQAVRSVGRGHAWDAHLCIPGPSPEQVLTNREWSKSRDE